MRIVFTALIIAASCSLVAAQSTTAPTGVTQPMTTAPSSATTFPHGQPKAKIKPPAYERKSGLRVGNDATDAGPVEIRRIK